MSVPLSRSIATVLSWRAKAAEAYPALAVQHAECAIDELRAVIADSQRRATRYEVVVRDGLDEVTARYPAYGIAEALHEVDQHVECGRLASVECDGIEVYAAMPQGG